MQVVTTLVAVPLAHLSLVVELLYPQGILVVVVAQVTL
jgi:hypothetical protein